MKVLSQFKMNPKRITLLGLFILLFTPCVLSTNSTTISDLTITTKTGDDPPATIIQNITKNDKCNSVSCVSDSDKVLRIAVLLPGDVTDNELHITSIEYQNRLKQILPGIEVISGLNKNPLENINNNNGMQLYQSNLSKILPGWKIEVITGETKCSPTDGILESFRLQCQAG